MIVIVDDHVDTGNVLVRLLAHVGLPAVALTCGAALLEFLQSKNVPTLVVLDVTMPGMDGIECLTAIRASTQWRNVPVIMYSAEFARERVEAARKLGAKDYLIKGVVGWDDFLVKIRQHAAEATQ